MNNGNRVLSQARGPYSAAPCPRNSVDHARAAAEIHWRDCAVCAGDGVGAARYGRRAVPRHPRQHRLIGPVLRDRWIGLDLAGDASGQLDVGAAFRQLKCGSAA